MGKRTFLSCCLAIALILTGYQGTNAQPNISSFVVYAGSGGTGTTTPPTGYGVFIGSSITVTGGKVGANSFVQTSGNATINADIHSHGLVSITNSNVVGGKITAANSAGAIGTILSVGSSTNISGNIDVNGNIVIGGGIVSGRVTHPVGTTYTGIGHSASILCEIAAGEQDDTFTLCYLWQGAIHQSIKDMHQGETFYGYTMLDYDAFDSAKVLKGSYFTNRKGAQTRGGIVLTWVSLRLKHKIE